MVPSNNTKLIHWPLMGGLLHLVQRRGDWARPQPTQVPPRCTISDQCTNHRIAVYCMVRCSAVLMCPQRVNTFMQWNLVISCCQAFCILLFVVRIHFRMWWLPFGACPNYQQVVLRRWREAEQSHGLCSVVACLQSVWPAVPVPLIIWSRFKSAWNVSLRIYDISCSPCIFALKPSRISCFRPHPPRSKHTQTDWDR